MASRSRLFSKIAKDVDVTGNLTASALGADISLGVTTYDSAGQLPLSGLSSGDQAWVGDRLFISNGSGWLNTGLVNLTPSITSGPAGAEYNLDSVGNPAGQTSTQISLTAFDSDGTGVNWSYIASDSANDLAVISNDSNGTFTFTSKSLTDILAAGYDSNGGSFSVTFKASDGIAFDTDFASFTLSYSSSAFDLASTVSLVNSSNITNSGEQGIEVTQDGAYLLQADNLANVHIWSMTTAYDVSTAGSEQIDQYTGIGTPYNDDYIGGIRVSTDLSQAFIANSAYGRMIRFGQTSSNIDYPGHVSQTANQQHEGNNIYLYLNSASNFWDIAKDGSAFYGVTSNERLWIHTMNTPYDLSSFSGNPVGNIDVRNVSGVPVNSWNVSAVAANDDGTRIWIGTNQSKIYQFDLSTANDPSTLTYTGEYSSASVVAGLAYANGYLYVEHNGSISQLGN